MKPKGFQKKLGLNKKTIAHLNNGQLVKVKGGIQNPQPAYTDLCETAAFTNCYLQCKTIQACTVSCVSCATVCFQESCDNYFCPIENWPAD